MYTKAVKRSGIQWSKKSLCNIFIKFTKNNAMVRINFDYMCFVKLKSFEKTKTKENLIVAMMNICFFKTYNSPDYLLKH